MRNHKNEKGIALVTGGSGGIGAACCKSLAEAGYTVGIHYNRGKDSAESLAESLPGAFTLQSNLSTQDGMENVYSILKREYGGNLAILVNNAGIALDNPLFSASSEDFDTSIAVNLKSAWYLTKRLSRLMIRRKEGRIINISSVIASTGNPTQSVYGMTKAALENLTKTAAKELAPYNILVNAIAPGFVRTAMTEKLSADHQAMILRQIPLARMGEAEEIAEWVRFLSTGGTYCTGTVIHVNGGMYGG
jgi:3-oxoacyl-[acyl-carrier protein] reductase